MSRDLSPRTNIGSNIFRWYRPGAGRYTQADPIGLSGDPHPYAYALGDPLGYFDPLGLATIEFKNFEEKNVASKSQLWVYCPKTSLSCTVFSTDPEDNQVDCSCHCSGEGGWRVSLHATFYDVKMILAPPISKNKTHEQQHIAHLKKTLEEVEALDFDSKEMCENKCLGFEKNFNNWMKWWAEKSNKELH